jgi:hypothetical protein
MKIFFGIILFTMLQIPLQHGYKQLLELTHQLEGLDTAQAATSNLESVNVMELLNHANETSEPIMLDGTAYYVLLSGDQIFDTQIFVTGIYTFDERLELYTTIHQFKISLEERKPMLEQQGKPTTRGETTQTSNFGY